MRKAENLAGVSISRFLKFLKNAKRPGLTTRASLAVFMVGRQRRLDKAAEMPPVPHYRPPSLPVNLPVRIFCISAVCSAGTAFAHAALVTSCSPFP